MFGMIVGTALSIAATVIMLYAHWGVMALAVGFLVRSLVALPINLYALTSNLRHKISLKMVRFNSAQLQDFLKASLWLGPAKTAETLISQVNNIILVRILGPGAVAVFNLTAKVIYLLVQIAGRFSASFLSGLAHLYGSGEEQKFRDVIKPLFRVTTYMCLTVIPFVLVLNSDFIRLWVGSELYGGGILTLLICIYGILKIVRTTLYNVVFSRNEIRVTSAAYIAEAIVQVGAGVILTILWGIKGVALASILAVIVGGLVQARALGLVLNIRYRLSLSSLFKYSAVAGVPLLLAILIKGAWPISTWGGLLIYAIGYAFVASIVVALCERTSFNVWRIIIGQKATTS
jgi:O-antigen/teichoic acid export membrane protein